MRIILKQNFISAIGAICILLTSTSYGAETSKESAWGALRKKIRAADFSEFMTPAIQGNPSSVPFPDGKQFLPTNIYNIFWADYEFSPNTHFLYWQRTFLFLTSNDVMQAQLMPRDPRFALRKTQLFDVANLKTTFDFYVQPPLSNASSSTGRIFDFGVRTNSSYSLTGSRWSLGMITELTGGFIKESGSGADLWGFLNPWVSYDLTPKFSTQHWVNVPFQHIKGTSWNHLQWDDPSLPYIQNGFGMNITQNIWGAVFVNNYLYKTPKWENTWASLWLNVVLF